LKNEKNFWREATSTLEEKKKKRKKNYERIVFRIN